jgi:prophage tail gpP-like protein
MQCVISVVNSYSNFSTRGQKPRSDEGTPKDAAEQEATAGGTLRRYSPLLTIMEHPVWTPAEVALRNATETMWRSGEEIEATVTVQGWFTSGGMLWQAGREVFVKSPMAMLNQVLTIDTVTFTQDSRSGSTTTLLCKLPWSLNATSGYASPTPPPAPSKATDPNKPAGVGHQ